MRKDIKLDSQLLLDAVADFQTAGHQDRLWERLNRHLSGFCVSGSIYGAEMQGPADRDLLPWFNSLGANWLDAKLGAALFSCDEYVRAARCETAPILWSDTSRLTSGHMTAEAISSLAIDFDFGIVTGVTIPMRFAGGLGVSSIGCHAEGMSWPEFDRVWHQHHHAITTIVNAFDVALRRDFAATRFELSLQQRDCLTWLAAGRQHQQIADRLHLSDRQVETRFRDLRVKLGARTNAQALAICLVFGLITP